MKVIEAEYSGFCFGVKEAVKIALKEYDSETYTYGPIIHNEEFQKKMDAKNIAIIDDVGNFNNVNLIIRAHGVKEQVYIDAEKNNINLIDATCPYVKKIHRIVREDYNKGNKIIIIGDEKHPEIVGINGWCNDSAIIIKNKKNKLSNFKKYDTISVVCQTTYNYEKYLEIKEILKNKFTNIVFYDTICSATTNRQSAAIELAKKVDLMIIVGGKKSSNTKKLYELCKDITKSILIQNETDYDLSDIANLNSIGIIGGASTPDWVINKIKNKMDEGEVLVNGK